MHILSPEQRKVKEQVQHISSVKAMMQKALLGFCVIGWLGSATRLIRWIGALGVIGILSVLPLAAAAMDDENCLMCHRYRKLGIIGANGEPRFFYMDEADYAHSLHRNTSCRGCHTYIRKIPHDPVIELVDCTTHCHIKEPFSNREFSHQRVADELSHSAHRMRKGSESVLNRYLPDCKYCHTNEVIDFGRSVFPPEMLKRCVDCHETRGVTIAYRHMTQRLEYKTTRSAREIAALCSDNCHDNPEVMSHFTTKESVLDAVETYKHSFHWKAIVFGDEHAGECVNCHSGHSIHDIRPISDPLSAIHPDNILQSCNQIDCHTNATYEMTLINVHPTEDKKRNPVIYVLLLFFSYLTVLTVGGLVTVMLMETYRRVRDGRGAWRVRKHQSLWNRLLRNGAYKVKKDE